jgi:hypothetical protein
MPMDIDGLQIEITENSEKAVSGLDALTRSLERLKKVTGDLGKSLEGVNFDKFGKQIKQLSTALQPLQGFKTQASGLLSSLRHFTIMAEDFNEFTRFDKFASQIKLLAESLKPLSNFNTKLGATLNALTQLPATSEQLETVNFKSFGEKITSLSQSLSPLGTIQSKLGATLNQLTRFGQVTQQLDMVLKESDVSENILNLVKSLEPLSTLGKSNLGSTLNQLKKLPEIIEQLHKVDMEAFGNQIERVVTAIKPLADEMNKVAAGFNAFPARIQKLITQSERLAQSNKRLGRSYNILGISVKAIYTKIGILYLGLKKAADLVSDWVIESNKYVENLNLFRVSMRGAADEALDYAFKVKEAFGIDPSEWIRFQAVFQNMYTGFGVAADKATIMSKALTQLGYDLATIFNVDYDIAMEKLESAISGQPRPMREWGFDMSEATLKLVALKHGIEENVETMTQYEKSQLRFIQLMETARKQGILGNFAREIHTPANALRILNQQFLLLRRALGDMFIPLLMKIVPYVQAVVQALTELANWVANLLGFELPKIDYSGLEGIGFAADDVAEGLEDATDAANKLNKALAPFDEINLLNLRDEIGESLDRLDLGIDLGEYDYDFLAEAVERQVDRIMDKIRPAITWIKDNFNIILDVVKSIGIAFAAWKLSNFFLDNINNLRNLLKGEVEPITKIAIGLTLIITGVYLEFQGAKAIGKGDAKLFNYIEAAIGAALGIAGSLLVLGTGPLGWTVSTTITLITFIEGIRVGMKEKLSESIEKALSEGGISITELSNAFSKRLNEIVIEFEPVIKGGEKLRQLKENIDEAKESIQTLFTVIKSNAGDSAVELEKLIEAMSNLLNETQLLRDQAYSNIVHALSNSFIDVQKTVGVATEEIIKNILLIKNKNDKKLTDAQMKIREYQKAWQEGEISIEEATKRIMKQYDTIYGGMGIVDEVGDSFLGFVSKLERIDWSDEAKRSEALLEIGENAKKAKEEVDQWFDAMTESIEVFLKDIDDPALRQEMAEALYLFRDEEKDAAYTRITDNVKLLFSQVEMDLVRRIKETSDNAAQEWENLEWWKKWLKPKENYVRESIESLKNDFMKPVSEKFTEILGEFGEEGGDEMLQVVDNILQRGFVYSINGAGPYIAGFGEDISQLTTDELAKMEESFKKLAEKLGIAIPESIGAGVNSKLEDLKASGADISNNLITGVKNELEAQKPQLIKDFETAGNSVSNGLLKGVENQLEKDKPWYKKAFDGIKTLFKNIFGIKSPSTVFKGFGENIMEGLLKGMEGWDIDFENIFKGIVNTGIEMINKFISWLNSTLSFSWSDKYVMGVKVLSAGSIQFVNIPQIPKLYARGGFPSTGELFVAREAGPELVGSIGGRTAVVNNDQIVEAVSQGVYEAVSMALRLNTRSEESRDLVINIDGRTMARIELPHLNEEAQRLGYAPILRYAEGGV